MRQYTSVTEILIIYPIDVKGRTYFLPSPDLYFKYSLLFDF